MTTSRRFPNWLREYMSYTRDSEAPDMFHFWTGASVIAGALRRKVWIDQRYFQWTPNLYVVFVAPPGIGNKSTSVNIGMRLLREIEGVFFGPNSLTWQGLTLALEEAKDHVQISEETFIPMSCLTIPISELGTFLKPDDTDLVDLLVDLWDGQQTVWRHKTRTTGEATIVNPWMNIIGCVTPAWLRQNFPMYIVEGGLTSRIIFVYADQKRKFVAYPSEVLDQQAFQRHGELLVEDLRTISQLQGEFTIAQDALDWGTTWYEKHWSNREHTIISERFSGYLARKQTHIHKLAMILAVAQRDDLVITLTDLEEAARIITSLELDLEKVFRAVGIQEVGRSSNDVLAVIRAKQEVAGSELMRIFLNQMDHRQMDLVLDTLLRGGMIQKKMVKTPQGQDVLGYAITESGLQDKDVGSPEPPLKESQ